MRRLLARLFVLLVLLETVASAQMDPRNAHGVPRPDPSVPVGTLTILVLQGEMMKHVDGVPVTLVGVLADGTLQKLVAQTDDTGHATFTDLRTDGTSSYYAFCLLGDDRLESDAVTLDWQAGVKMLLDGRKLDPDGKPVGAPLDDERQGGDVPVVPVGQLYIVLRGHLSKDVDLVLKELGSDDVVQRGTASPPPVDPKNKDASADKLIAVFDHLPTGQDHVYYAETTIAGRKFRTHPAVLSARAGATRGVIVVNQLLFSMQGGAELDDDRLAFQLQLDFLNGTGVPWSVGKDGLTVPLPAGFRSATLKDDAFGDRVAVIPGEGVHFTGVFPPGGHSTIVSFVLPQKDGVVDFEMPVPFGIYDSQVAIEKGAGDAIEPLGGVPAPDVKTMDDGRDFYVVGNLEMQPGQIVSFRVTGLPEPSVAQAVARIMAGIIVLAIIIWVLVIVLTNETLVKAAPVDRQSLSARRDRLYEQLVAMARVRRAGDEDIRRSIVERLAAVLRELDELGAPAKKARRAS